MEDLWLSTLLVVLRELHFYPTKTNYIVLTKYLTVEQYTLLHDLEKRLPELECDGLTLVLSQWLYQVGIPHVRCSGFFMQKSSQRHLPHWWIEFPDGVQMCFRSRMWFGKDAPHGLFILPDEHIEYDCFQKHGPVESSNLAQILFGLPSFFPTLPTKSA